MCKITKTFKISKWANCTAGRKCL